MIGVLWACLRVLVIGAVLMFNIQISHSAGALAIGSCGAYGYSYDYPNGTAAKASARKQCNGDCKIIDVRKSCGAIAVDAKATCGAHGYAVARQLGQAQNTALRQCYTNGGRDCMIRAFMCDARG